MNPAIILRTTRSSPETTRSSAKSLWGLTTSNRLMADILTVKNLHLNNNNRVGKLLDTGLSNEFLKLTAEENTKINVNKWE